MLAGLLILVALGGWEAYVDLGAKASFVLPAPHAVAQALYDDHALLWSNLLVTGQEILLGILVALGVGFALAVAIHLSATLRQAVYPLLVASQAVPVVVVAPLLVFWWGFGLASKLAVITLICFFPVVVTTVDALGAVDPELLKLLRTLDASRWQRLRLAEAPAALPAALSGARILLAVAAIGAVFAEYVGSDSGLGHLIQTSLSQFQTPRAYAAVVVLALFAIACFYALTVAERRLAPWAHPPRGSTTP
jgi:putative hydroxymethylpyrimidine transport system permease protein